MSPPRPARRPSAPRRTYGTALIAALVLLVQGAFPTWAVARAVGAAPLMIQMCSQGGETYALLDHAPAHQTQHDCCDPAVFAAALPAPGPEVLAKPVRYAVPTHAAAVIAGAPSTRARDPPRPPSQAPPQTV